MVHGNISGGGRQRNGMSSVDFYRRVPKDLTEATTLGAFMSLCAMLVMALLFSAETFAFARTNISTEIALDDNTAPQIQLNFNITLFALQCDYVSVDVWDVLGTNRQNVTKNIEKWQVDKDGKRKTFSGRNRETREVKHQEHRETLEDLHENGVHVTPLNSKEEFFDWLDEHEMAFVNFFAPWCMWCQRLHPTWEKVAEEIENTNVPVGIANVDCQAHSDLCREQRVMAFPTLRWYEAKEPQAPDYKSVNHNLNAAMTNLTHRVNHLSFGEMGKDQSRSVKRALKQVPESLRQFTPLDGTMHTTREFHKAHHHYIKVVSTHLNMGYIGVPTLYQFLEQSQIVAYDEVNVPEARFSYDLSPMSVVVEKTGRKWYDYLTSLCAIIGGTFTTLGLIDAVLYKVFKPKKL